MTQPPLAKFLDNYGAVLLMLFFLAVIFGSLVVSWVRPQKQDRVVFEIVGVNNQSINATTLTQLHYECIKFCANKFYDMQGKLTDCYTQCATLGKEKGCE